MGRQKVSIKDYQRISGEVSQANSEESLKINPESERCPKVLKLLFY